MGRKAASASPRRSPSSAAAAVSASVSTSSGGGGARAAGGAPPPPARTIKSEPGVGAARSSRSPSSASSAYRNDGARASAFGGTSRSPPIKPEPGTSDAFRARGGGGSGGGGYDRRPSTGGGGSTSTSTSSTGSGGRGGYGGGYDRNASGGSGYGASSGGGYGASSGSTLQPKSPIRAKAPPEGTELDVMLPFEPRGAADAADAALEAKKPTTLPEAEKMLADGPQLKPKSSGICHDFTKGMCTRGEKCRFTHTAAEGGEGGGAAAGDLSKPAAEAAAMGTESDEYTLTMRPGFGKTGRQVPLDVNFFPITFDPGLNWHQYRIDFDSKTTEAVRRDLLYDAEDLHKDKIGNVRVVYDGDAVLITAKPLPNDDFAVALTDPRDRKKAKEDRAIVTMRFAKVAEINMQTVNNYYNGYLGATPELPQAVINAINLVLRNKSAGKNYVGRFNNFYDKKMGSQDIGGGCEVWNGWHQSVRASMSQLTINIDISTCAFYKPIKLLDYLSEAIGLGRKGDFVSSLSTSQIQLASRALKGMTVTTNHIKVKGHTKEKRYKIRGIGSKAIADCFFEREDEDGTKTRVNVVDYFQQAYDTRLKYPQLPPIEQRGSGGRVIHLPLELCTVAGGQALLRKCSDVQTASMIKFTTKKPQQRRQEIARIVDKISLHKDGCAGAFGIGVSDKMATVTARVLPSPRIANNDSNGRPQAMVVRDKTGAWDFNRKKVLKPGKAINNWAVVNFSRQVQEAAVYRTFDILATTAVKTGVMMSRQPCIPMKSRPNAYPDDDSIKNVIGEVINEATRELKSKNQSLDKIFVVLDDTNAAFYQAVKHATDAIFGIPCQCLNKKWFSKFPIQAQANIAIKANAKAGGVNFTAKMASGGNRQLLVTESGKKTMVIGGDLTHPPKMDEDMYTLASLVGSMDLESGRYIARIEPNPAKVDIIDNIQSMMGELLDKYVEINGAPPEAIVYYRDGVSEGQFQEVLQMEYSGIKAAVIEASTKAGLGAVDVPITVCIVQKRHHVRFFQNNGQYTDRSGNAQPGTVVDSCVTHPKNFDFYLQSHAGIQGTSRPTHYTVIMDECKFGPDEFQNLTFALCHCYQRATRAVSIPCAVYYAHQSAFRARALASRHNVSTGVSRPAFLDPNARQFQDDTGGSSKRRSPPRSHDDGYNQPVDPNSQTYRDTFRNIHENIRDTMYFC